VQDPITRATAIQSGEVDVLIAADATTLPQLKADPNLALLEAKGALLMSMVMMVDQPPFDDPRVRQALKLVVDRPAMVQLVSLGFGVPGNDNTVPPTSPLAIRTEPIPQDIEKAKALLAEAGYSDGLTVELWTGITVNVQTAPSNSFWDDVYLKQPFVTSYWYTRHPVSSMSLAFRKDAQYNETHWRRDDFDKLLDEAATTLDPGKSAELYKQAQQIIMDEGGQIVPLFASLVAAVRKGCTGYVPHVESRVMFGEIVCD
jgi:peptide/nickel transport system substrate-binding protein